MNKELEKKANGSIKPIDLTINTCQQSHLDESIIKSAQLLDGSKCPRCHQLQATIQVLQKELEKLQHLLQIQPNLPIQLSQSLPITSIKTHHTTTKPQRTPRNNQKPSFSFETLAIDWQAEKKLLKSLEERAEKLCQKERKQRKIIKQLISDRESLRSSKASLPASSKKEVEIENQKEVLPIIDIAEKKKIEITQPVKIQTQKVDVQAESPEAEKQQKKEEKEKEERVESKVEEPLIQTGNKQVKYQVQTRKEQVKSLVQTLKEEVKEEKKVEKPEKLVFEEVRSEDTKQKKREIRQTKTSSRLKKAATTILYSSSKTEEMQNQLDDLIEGFNQSEGSDLSGSRTSERKSMLEGMKTEQLKEYYTKNLKQQKLMAKLKKKKK